MRISRHQMFMEMSRAVAKRSTCPRLNVGAIIVSPSLEIFMGYNGSEPGEDHCIDVGCLIMKNSCIRTIHAEENALRKIPYAPSDEPQMVIYITNSPCSRCTDRIIASRHIRAVYFENEYRSIDHLHQFEGHGITVLRIVPNGCIMNLQGDVIET